MKTLFALSLLVFSFVPSRVLLRVVAVLIAIVLLLAGTASYAANFTMRCQWITSQVPDTSSASDTVQCICSIVFAAPPTSGGTITITNLGYGGLSPSPNPETLTVTTTAPYITQGATRTYNIALPGNPDAATSTTTTKTTAYPLSVNQRLAVTSSWGGQTNDVQTNDFCVRVNQTGALSAPTLKQFYRTIVVYPPGFEKLKFQILVNTRSELVYRKDYLVCFNGESLGDINGINGANPRVGGSFLFDRDYPTITTCPAICYRRIAPGTWVPIWSGNLTAGVQQIINDFPDDPLPDNGSTTPPPDQAQTVGSTGASTGQQGSTAGNGLTPTTSGGSTTNGSGTSPSTNTGGAGSTGLTAAQVQEAVHQGDKQAGNDTVSPGMPNFGDTGIGTPTDKDAEINGFKGATEDFAVKAVSIDAPMTSVNAFTTYSVPSSVGTSAMSFSATVPIIGAFTIDLTPYSEHIGIIRALLLAVVTVYFIFLNIKVARSAIG